MPENTLLEEAEEGDDAKNLPELHQDDDSSSASSASSTGTIVPSLSRRRFANEGFVKSDRRLCIFILIDSLLRMIRTIHPVLAASVMPDCILLTSFLPQPIGCPPLDKSL